MCYTTKPIEIRSLGKGFDGWAPIGPAIISPSLIPDPQKLRISTKVNERTVQDSSTADMIFSVAKTLSFLSQGTTLLPGDVVFTGTVLGWEESHNAGLKMEISLR
jgi:2-keto-4-pentenoate hydratase/2-oxohepta-3-ene-1,7-dioic acid hydratase in catechol pathway